MGRLIDHLKTIKDLPPRDIKTQLDNFVIGVFKKFEQASVEFNSSMQKAQSTEDVLASIKSYKALLDEADDVLTDLVVIEKQITKDMEAS